MLLSFKKKSSLEILYIKKTLQLFNLGKRLFFALGDIYQGFTENHSVKQTRSQPLSCSPGVYLGSLPFQLLAAAVTGGKWCFQSQG